MTETIPISCPDLMHPQTSKCLKKAGPSSQRGSKTWQPALQVWTHLLSQSHSTGLSLLTSPSTPQIPTSLSFKAAKLFSQKQVKLRALQSSSHTILLQSLVLHLSSQNKLSLPSLSLLQWFGLLAHELAWLPAWQSQTSRITWWKAPSLPLHEILGSNSVFAVALSDLNAQDSWKSRKE